MNNLPQKAISIRQPWPWLILNGGKNIENRDWKTTFRGPVCIHAAKGMTADEYESCLRTVHLISRTHPFPSGLTLPAAGELERGGIVGTVEIVDCIEDSDCPWYSGLWGFVLRNPQPVAFIPVKGALGFFHWHKNIITPQESQPGKQGALSL